MPSEFEPDRESSQTVKILWKLKGINVVETIRFKVATWKQPFAFSTLIYIWSVLTVWLV